ncbi:MAG: signal peptidase II [Gammaproteobacteria bacterium]|jgi:signal peptidase II
MTESIPGRRAIHWLWLSALIIVADQVTKYLVVTHMSLFESVPLVPHVQLTLLHNTGAAFSILADAGGWQRWVFVTLGLAVSAAVAAWLWRMSISRQPLLAAGLSLVVGGALGNVVDRVVRGHVIDFIDLYYRNSHWPPFNLADSAITVGAIIILLDSFRRGEHGLGPLR